MPEIFGITFLDYYYIFLIILAILWLILDFFVNKKFGVYFEFLEDVKKVYKKSSLFYYLKKVLILTIFLAYIVVLMNPNVMTKEKKELKPGIDIVFTLDLSWSMLASDLKPNRLEAAKNVIEGFIKDLQSDRVGLVVFAGKTFTSMPLSLDYKTALDKVNQMTIDTVSKHSMELLGTAIGDSLLYSTSLFNEESERKKVIILITDGVSNRGYTPGEAAKFAKTKGITLYTVGVGGYENVFIPELGLNITGVNDRGLNFLAQTGAGKYYRSDDNEALKNIFEEIESLEKTKGELEEKSYFNPIYLPFVLVVIMLVFFLFYLEYAYKLKFKFKK
ncbi:MAG: VWA domain-containing protein [Candidatus Gracilibacteria bacterium]|nr:VWA domain-containing protein [Candidatus Gracilibacteria bacterium]